MTAARNQVVAALAAALDHYERNICEHTSTHRGGSIWTFCDDCGAQWADDRGGFKPFQRPREIEEAYEVLARHRIAHSDPRPVAGADADELADAYVGTGDRDEAQTRAWHHYRQGAADAFAALATHSPAPMAGVTYDFDMAYNGGYAAAAAPMQLEIDRLRGALEAIGKFVDDFHAPWGSWKTAWWEGEVSDDAALTDNNALKHVADMARRAAHPSTQEVQDNG